MSGIYDVTEAFDDLLEPITLLKQLTGEYVEGEWVETREPKAIQAVVQPMDYSEVKENDPTAPRDVQAIEIWTEQKIITVSTDDKNSGDGIIWNGKEYTVVEVTDYKRIGGYYSAIAYMNKGN